MAVNPVAVVGLSPWEILGLHRGAAPEEIRGAMRLLAKVIHPDVLPRGKALFQVVQAAAAACANGGRWPPDALDKFDGFERKTPQPAQPTNGKHPWQSSWRSTKKGNFARSVGPQTWINVYFAKDGSGWRFLTPDGKGGTYFDNETFPTALEAQEAADAKWGGF